jgi:hypothetical protein
MLDVIAVRHARDLVEGQFADLRPPRRGQAVRTRRHPVTPVQRPRSAYGPRS